MPNMFYVLSFKFYCTRSCNRGLRQMIDRKE